MTQRQLASHAGIGRQQISEIESGRSGMHVTSLLRILDALDYELQVVEKKLDPSRINLDEILGLGSDDG